MCIRDSNYAKKSIEWYVAPKPLICMETPAYYSILEEGNFSIVNLSGYNPKIGVSNLIWKSTTLKLYFFHAGRIPASTSYVEIFIIPKNEVLEEPFPFKILSIRTPLDGFYYDKERREFVRYPQNKPFSYGYWYRENGTLEYPPLVVNNTIHQINMHFKLGTIYPQQGVNVTIEIFSTTQNAWADLLILLSYCSKSTDEVYIKEWKIPISS